MVARFKSSNIADFSLCSWRPPVAGVAGERDELTKRQEGERRRCSRSGAAGGEGEEVGEEARAGAEGERVAPAGQVT